MKRTIENLEDIRFMVNTFYERVRADGLIGPIFNERIGDRWPEHLDKMYRFWQTILLEERTYEGAPFRPHADLPVFLEHFERWVELFEANLLQHFEGDKADEALERAGKMAKLFHSKREFLRQHGV